MIKHNNKPKRIGHLLGVWEEGVAALFIFLSALLIVLTASFSTACVEGELLGSAGAAGVVDPAAGAAIFVSLSVCFMKPSLKNQLAYYSPMKKSDELKVLYCFKPIVINEPCLLFIYPSAIILLSLNAAKVKAPMQ